MLIALVSAAPVWPELCLKRMMLFENRFASLRFTWSWLLACSLPLFAVAAAAQSPGSDSSSPQSAGQAGTTAAPGSAPIRSRTTAQQIAPVRVATYDEKYEIFGGLDLMNGQAGQNLPKRYNMGGGEVMGTYWLGPRLGVAADYRIGAGTTDVFPTQFFYAGHPVAGDSEHHLRRSELSGTKEPLRGHRFPRPGRRVPRHL